MRLPASSHSHADTNGHSDIKVSAVAESVSSVTVTHPTSNGTDSLVTSESKCTDTHTVHVTPSTVVHNGSVTLPISQDKVDDTVSTSQSNGAVTLARSAVVSSSISTTPSRL